MSLRTPLAKVRGLGSARAGTRHWWAQRLTAIVLVPLTLWFVYSLAGTVTLDYLAAIGWLQSPIVCALLILFVFALFYHAELGMRVVIEDYVDHEALKIGGIIILKFVMWFAALAGVVAILKIFLGL